MHPRAPRFYQVRVMESKSYMASFVAKIQETGVHVSPSICEIDCIFSNLDDSGIDSAEELNPGDNDIVKQEPGIVTTGEQSDKLQPLKPHAGDSDFEKFRYRLRIKGRATLVVPVKRQEEAGFLSERIRACYEEGLTVNIRRIRP